MTYRALKDTSCRVASGLRDLGAGRGTCLAVFAPNCAEWVVAAIAIMRAGGSVSGASAQFRPPELARHLLQSRASFLLTTRALLDVARAAVSTVRDVQLIVTGSPVKDAIGFAQLAEAEISDLSPPLGDDTAMLPFSSGTTSLPKPVDLTHRALAVAALQARTVVGLTCSDKWLALAPLHFILGSAVVMIGGLTAGTTLVLVPRYELRFLLQLIAQEKVTVTALVPPVMTALARSPGVEEHDLSSLRLILCGGAAVPPDVERCVAQRLKTTVMQGYGMTETSATIALNPPDAPRPGTVGRLFPGVECRVVEIESGNDLGTGQEGEIWLRSPALMRGYLGDASSTRRLIDRDGWLHTGDIGFFDEDEYLHLTGRRKELIKVNAFAVAPAELEALLATHPAVADVAVIGRKSAAVGEVPIAYVVPRTRTSAEELMDWVSSRVAAYKRICAVEFTDLIPRSPAGKTLRRELAELDSNRCREDQKRRTLSSR